MLNYLTTMLTGGVNQMLATIADETELLGDEVNDIVQSVTSTPFWPVWDGVWEMLIRLFINIVTVAIDETMKNEIPRLHRPGDLVSIGHMDMSMN